MKMLLVRAEFVKRFPKSQTATTCSKERNKRVFYFHRK